jgi:hypothetical protein
MYSNNSGAIILYEGEIEWKDRGLCILGFKMFFRT